MRYAFKKARALRINNLETDELEVRLVDLKTVTWTNGQETVYAEGTDGAKLAAFDNNKVSTLKATNGTVDTGYLAMAVGADEEVIQNGSEISLCEIYKVTNATKITLNHKATGAVGAEIKFIYAVDKQKNKIDTYDQAAEASETAFAYAPDTKEITLPTGKFKIGDRVLVEYHPKFSEYRKIVNDSNKFSKSGRIVLDAWFHDICDDVDVPLQVVMERGKVSGNFELAFGDQAAVMNVEIEGMTGTCSDETQALWTLYDYDMSKIIDT